MKKKRIAVLATASSSGEIGGAERFYVGLRDALRTAGADAEIVSVVSDESNFDRILESYLRFYDLDLDDFDGVISTKAPGYAIRHRNHVCYLQHTMRVFYDMFDHEFPNADARLRAQRKRIVQLDTEALRNPRVRKRFVIGHEVNQRLRLYNGLDAEVLYQTTTLSGLRSGNYRYLFMPSRLHRWKRVDLVIRAMNLLDAPIDLLIAGSGEDEAQLRRIAEGNSRIKFLGRVSDEQLIDLYADALAIPFVPLREDFGLIAVEAFCCEKPVITCEDSGEPARMVETFGGGIVCAPDPAAIASIVDSLVTNPGLGHALGAAGRRFADEFSWSQVAAVLLDALGIGAAPAFT
jgi:glycosyltransferase involved in cell wall biosynthesis